MEEPETRLELERSPPPPEGEAPPSYDSIDHTLNRFHNPWFEARGEEEGEEEGPPPPYSPGHAAPPDYYSLFGQIREARQQSGNSFTFLTRVSKIILSTVGCTILLVVFMSIPITVLVLGSVYVGQCEIEPYIPIFLIVGGISGSLKNVSLISESLLKRCSHRLPTCSKKAKYAKYVWKILNLVFNLFMFAWIIAGSYWIYHVYAEVNSTAYRNCNEVLYKFSFGILTSSYILLVLMCCCTCCCGLCLRRNVQNQEEREGTEGGGRSDSESGDSGGEGDNGSDTGEGGHSNEDEVPHVHTEYSANQNEQEGEEEAEMRNAGTSARPLLWADNLPSLGPEAMNTGAIAVEGASHYGRPNHSAVFRSPHANVNSDQFQLTEYACNSPIFRPSHPTSHSHVAAGTESPLYPSTKPSPIPISAVPSPTMLHSKTLEPISPTLYVTQTSNGYSHTAV